MDAIDYYEGALEKLIKEVRVFQVSVLYNLFLTSTNSLHCEAFHRSLPSVAKTNRWFTVFRVACVG